MLILHPAPHLLDTDVYAHGDMVESVVRDVRFHFCFEAYYCQANAADIMYCSMLAPHHKVHYELLEFHHPLNLYYNCPISTPALRIGTSIGLKGDGFLELPPAHLDHAGDPEASDSAVVFVSTEQPEGMLLWQGDTKEEGQRGRRRDFLALDSKRSYIDDLEQMYLFFK